MENNGLYGVCVVFWVKIWENLLYQNTMVYFSFKI